MELDSLIHCVCVSVIGRLLLVHGQLLYLLDNAMVQLAEVKPIIQSQFIKTSSNVWVVTAQSGACVLHLVRSSRVYCCALFS